MGRPTFGIVIVRVSDEDLAYLFPGTGQDDAEKRMAALCRNNLIVTHGEKGSSWITGSFRVDCPAFSGIGEIVDTVGCGDTFNGAVIAYLDRNGLIGRLGNLQKEEVEKMLDYASKAAGLNCLFEGCNPPRRVGNEDELE